jgi:hypothetical protein
LPLVNDSWSHGTIVVCTSLSKKKTVVCTGVQTMQSGRTKIWPPLPERDAVVHARLPHRNHYAYDTAVYDARPTRTQSVRWCMSYRNRTNNVVCITVLLPHCDTMPTVQNMCTLVSYHHQRDGSLAPDPRQPCKHAMHCSSSAQISIRKR